MGTSAIVAALVAVSAVGQALSDKEINKQDTVFQTWWGTEFEWKYDSLPKEGTVPQHRIPYSGYIYPDTAGGTVSALSKYDRAFNGNRYPATGYERWDTTAFQETTREGGGFGLFGRRFGGRTVTRTPHWHGHCNGWSAATIRHAEPKNNVVRNGVTFTPADIKGLLAELYIYNEMDVLAGSDTYMNAATLHTIITNWVGRGGHTIAMEADPGKEKWNYPIYAFATTSGYRGDNQVEVKMNIAYAKDSRGEFQESPHYKAQKYFHYYLNLNDEGKIVGGGYYRDSSRIDMLWIPLRPKAPRTPGNERGNPHVDVDTILALWRDSVPEEERRKWLVIDQPAADRVQDVAEGLAHLVPLQAFPDPTLEAEPSADAVAVDTSVETDAAVVTETETVTNPAVETETVTETTEAAAIPEATPPPTDTAGD